MDRRVVGVLEERALVERAVAEEADDHAVAAEQPQPERRPGRDAEAAADDTVRAEHPDREVGDVHRPALAPAAAALASEQLGHHRLDVDALRDRVAVTAMGRGDAVASAGGRSRSRPRRPPGRPPRCAVPWMRPIFTRIGTSVSNARMRTIRRYISIASVSSTPSMARSVTELPLGDSPSNVVIRRNVRAALDARRCAAVTRTRSCGSIVSSADAARPYCDFRTQGPLYETLRSTSLVLTRGRGLRRCQVLSRR